MARENDRNKINKCCRIKLKKFLMLMTVLVMVLGMFNLTGCYVISKVLNSIGNPNDYLAKNKSRPIVTSECGYFRVALLTDEGYAVVLELTESGKEQEILAIPSQVDGYSVKQIGWESWGFSFTVFGIESDNLKKIYVPYTVEEIIYKLEIKKGEYIFLSADFDIVQIDFVDNASIAVAAKECLDTLQKYAYFKERFILPNLIYFYNYEDAPNLNYYWFDNITGENLYISPNDPIREGFTFTGWYLDESCELEWDESLPSSSEENLTLYAGWEEL